MAVVVFDLAAFRARYPEFATVADLSITACFAEATLYCINDVSSVVLDLVVRAMLLNMLTAHIAAMNFGSNDARASDLVGRIASAGEGSVNVSAQYAAPAGSRAWYDQTKYGAAYWQASLRFRAARYIAPPQPTAFIRR